jgi:hypothetical protein
MMRNFEVAVPEDVGSTDGVSLHVHAFDAMRVLLSSRLPPGAS